LKELLAEFTTGVEDVRKRSIANAEKLAHNKATLEKHDVLITKIGDKADTVDTFHKRLLAAEGKLETVKDQLEQRHEATKDLVQRTKDMLEARVDQITQYNSRLEGMQDEITKLKDITGAYKDSITA
jgi:chromosome segregation ATPase